MSRTTDVQLMIDFVYEECVSNESNDSKMQNEMEITASSSILASTHIYTV